MIKNKVIAIDGPAGSGKSSTSKRVAKELGFSFFSTGIVYRAATVYCLAQEVPLSDPISIECAVRQMIDENALKMSFSVDDKAKFQNVFLGEQDVTNVLFDSKTTENVSKVSSCLPARKLLIDLQKTIINGLKDDGVVVEGRDICDIVFPEAILKILLTANEEVRAKRRSNELTSSETNSLQTQIQIRNRDLLDSKTTSFTAETKNSSDIQIVDNSDLTLDQTAEIIEQMFERKFENSKEKPVNIS